MKRLLPFSFLTMFVIGTDSFLVSPLLPTLERQFQVSDSIAPWMVGAYALGYAVFALVAGPISDRRDRKSVVILGLGSFAVSTLLCSFAHSFWTMLAYRAMAGISAALTTPQVWASLGTLLPRDKLVKGMGIATAGLALSQALGVPVASFLCTFSWHTPFYAVALASVLVMGLAFIWLPSQSATVSSSQRGVFRQYSHIFRNLPTKLIFIAYFLFQLGNFGRFSIVGLWMHERFELTVVQLGYVMLAFGIGNLVGSLFGSKVVYRFGEIRTLLGGIAVVTLICALMPLMNSSLWVEFLWGISAGIFGILFPLMMTLLQSHAPQARSTISGLANALMYGGTTLASLTCGELYAHVGGFVSVSVFSGVCFAAAIAVFYISHVLYTKMPKAHIVG